MRSPPHWNPPRPPASSIEYAGHSVEEEIDDESNYEDPEHFGRLKQCSSLALSATPNLYEVSASAQRRSAALHSVEKVPAASKKDLFADSHTHRGILHKNADGAYYIPSGLVDDAISPPSSSVRYHDDRCLQTPLTVMECPGASGSDPSQSLLRPGHPAKRPSSRFISQGTVPSSHVVPPFSTMSSLKKRPYDLGECSTRKTRNVSEASRCSSRSLSSLLSPCTLCLLFSLIASLGFILVLLFRSPNASPELRREDERALSVVKQSEGSDLHSLPARITLGQSVYAVIPSAAQTQLHISSPTRLAFNATLSRTARLVLMGKRGGPPSISDHDFLWPLSRLEEADSVTHRIDPLRRRKREAEQKHDVFFEHFMLIGNWFLRFVNEGRQREEVVFSVNAGASDQSCDDHCSGHGECKEGLCLCSSGYSGPRCDIPSCPIHCSGNGVIAGGKCVCHEGFKGADCSLLTTWCERPDCSGHGTCSPQGECECQPGWTGLFCQEKSCEVPDCSGNGICHSGMCFCSSDWMGSACQQKRTLTASSLYPIPSSIQRKKMAEELEVRSEGRRWKEQRLANAKRDGECSGNGEVSGRDENCLCSPSWTGIFCQKRECKEECAHGVCSLSTGECECWTGWTGPSCEWRSCALGCHEHGVCDSKTGICHCRKPWNGENCFSNGCPFDCGEHGKCQLNKDGVWSCSCDSPWHGQACSFYPEVACSDGKDNDNDGLTDCEDPDCCESGEGSCSESQSCSQTPSPSDILLRLSPTRNAPFLETIQFLTSNGSVQSYQTKPFDPRLASVIRGRVVWRSIASRRRGESSSLTLTQPLRAVRVSDSSRLQHGFTLTRNDPVDGDGFFDLLVEGGRSVQLLFIRLPFSSVRRSVFVEPNTILHLGDIEMELKESTLAAASPVSSSLSCRNEQSPLQVPVPTPSSPLSSGPAITPFNRFTSRASPKILLESFSVTDELAIPGTQLSLVYDSRRLPSSLSVVHLSLCPAHIHTRLRTIHMRLEVAGRVFSEAVSARPHLSHRLVWDRRNAYGQTMHGLVPAYVKVGYEFVPCTDLKKGEDEVGIVWREISLLLEGSETRPAKEIAPGWTISVHHHLDVVNGVLEYGDGGRVNLLQSPQSWESRRFAGIGASSVTDACTGRESDCTAFADSTTLSRPSSLAVGTDGSVFVVDADVIRRVSPDGVISNLHTLKGPEWVAGSVWLAVDPTDGSLHLSISDTYIISRIGPRDTAKRNLNTFIRGKNDYKVVAGVERKRCPSSSARDGCGDEGPADKATFFYPKGIAFDSSGNLYVADGGKVRVIEAAGQGGSAIRRRIRTVGDRSSFGSHGPAACPAHSMTSLPLSTLRLQWPTSLAVDQRTDILYVLDSNRVISVSTHGWRLLRGDYGACSWMSMSNEALHSSSSAAPPSSSSSLKDIAASPDGSLYLLETNDKSSVQVTRLSSNDEVTVFAGDFIPRQHNSSWAEKGRQSRLELQLAEPLSIAIDSRRQIFISDAASGTVRMIGPRILKADPATQLLRIVRAERNEAYFFDKNGRHSATQSLFTGRFIYNFTYSAPSCPGRLMSISSGSSLSLHLSVINETTKELKSGEGRRTLLHLSHFDSLLERVVRDGFDDVNVYYGSGMGRETRVTHGSPLSSLSFLPDGTLQHLVTEDGATIEVADYSETERKVSWISSGLAVSIRDSASIFNDLSSPVSLSIHRTGTESGLQLSVSPGMSDVVDVSSSGVPISSLPGGNADDSGSFATVRRLALLSSDSASSASLTLEWQISHSTRISLSRKALLNGYPLLTVEYSVIDKTDTFLTPDGIRLLSVHYDDSGRIKSFVPMNWNGMARVDVERDLNGKAKEVRWGDRVDAWERDERGRAIIRSSSWSGENLINWQATFGHEHHFPQKVSCPFGGCFSFLYTSEGHLREMIHPDGRADMFERLPLSSGGIALRRTNSRHPMPNIVIVDSFSNSWREWRSADGERHALRQMDSAGRAVALLVDSEWTHLRPGSSGILSEHSVEFRGNWEYGVASHLISRAKFSVRYSREEAWQRSQMRLEYDSLHRLIEVNLEATGATSNVKLEYDGKTHRLSSYGSFRVKSDRFGSQITGDEMGIERRMCGNGLVERIQVTTSSGNVSVQYAHDGLGRPVSASWSFSSSDQHSVSLHKVLYDSAGRVVYLERGDSEELRWRLTYAVNSSRVISVNEERIEWEEKEGLATPLRVSALPYYVDDNGWIQGIGASGLELDSLGRLRCVSIAGGSGRVSKVLSVIYDSDNRVVAFSGKENSARLFYASPQEPRKITHFTLESRIKGSVLYTLLYSDDHPLPFTMTSSKGDSFAVLFDEFSQLAFVVGRSGVIKKVIHGMFGEVVHDSNAEFFVPVGGALGGIAVLSQPSLAILGPLARPWDTRTGRFLSFSPDDILRPVDMAAPWESCLFSLPSSLNPTAPQTIPTDVSEWLKMQGLWMPRPVLPSLPPSIPPSFLSSTRFNDFASRAALLARLSTESASGLSSPFKDVLPSPGWAVSRATLAHLLQITLDKLNRTLDLSPSPLLSSDEQEVLGRLLKGATELCWPSLSTENAVEHRRFIVAFLNSPPPDIETASFNTLSVRRKDSLIEVSRDGAVLLSVHYGRDAAEKLTRDLERAYLRQRQPELWRAERRRSSLGTGRGSLRPSWSNSERLQLVRDGAIPGYTFWNGHGNGRLPSVYSWSINRLVL